MTEESHFLRHDSCPSCGSRDNLAVYTDHEFCFGCNFHNNTGEPDDTSRKRRVSNPSILRGEPFDKSVRGITPETFSFWKYTRCEHHGKPAHLATHYKDGQPVGQKVRYPGKDFSVRGDMEPLYGMWLWGQGGKKIVVTEGELDAISVSHVQSNKWPVVSVPNGAQGAVKSFQKAIDYLESFDEVVIMFDMDESGQKAAKECARVLSPGKAKIATLPLKDANEMLVAGRGDEIVRAMWNATPYRPDGIITLKDVRSDVVKPPEWGAPWPWKSLTNLTYGRRASEVYMIGAGTGIGKTDVLTECIAFDLYELQVPVGVLFLEQDVKETFKRVAGKFANQRFHVPDAGWTVDDLETSLSLFDNEQLHLFDSFGANDWETVKSRINYMALGLGCKHIYLDHLTALAAEEEKQREALERITAALAGLGKKLGTTMHVVSHLVAPVNGPSHEEGGRVYPHQFKGSRAISHWSHFMFGLERNTFADDEHERHRTTFRVLKDRYTGQSTNEYFYLKYEKETGRLVELDKDDGLPVELDAEDIF